MPLKGSKASKLREKKNNEKNINNSERYQRLKNNAELLAEGKEKAHKIVLRFIESNVTEHDFLAMVPYITPEHYEDVIVERAISGLCGYPLCDSTSLDLKLNNQTYTIRNNKVYDITSRRNFCSDTCFEASDLVAKQIPTTPLYLRKNDPEIKNLKIFVPDLSSLKGQPGKLVNITGALLDHELNIVANSKSQSSESSSKCRNPSKGPRNSTREEEAETNENLSLSESERSSSSSSPDIDTLLDKMQPLRLNQSGGNNGAQKDCVKTEATGRSEMKESNQKTSKLEDVYEIERTLREWMTFEALRAILGNLYVRGMLEELGKSWEDYDTTSGLRLGVESKAKYIALCKKLDEDEMRERILEASEVETIMGEGASPSPQQPMPDFDQLKKSMEESSLKVKAFYKGAEEVVSYKEELETIEEEEEEEEGEEQRKSGKKKKKAKTRKKVDSEKEEEEESVTLPLIDTYSQNTWRRQIVFEKLSKSLSVFVNEFGLDEGEIRTLIVSLISTFDLTSHNITLKSSQWKFVSLILLHMLSVRYPIINKAFSPEGRGFKMVSLFLKNEGLDSDYLKRLLSYLTEITYILTKYHRNDVSYESYKLSKHSTTSAESSSETPFSSAEGVNASQIPSISSETAGSLKEQQGSSIYINSGQSSISSVGVESSEDGHESKASLGKSSPPEDNSSSLCETHNDHLADEISNLGDQLEKGMKEFPKGHHGSHGKQTGKVTDIADSTELNCSASPREKQFDEEYSFSPCGEEVSKTYDAELEFASGSETPFTNYEELD